MRTQNTLSPGLKGLLASSGLRNRRKTLMARICLGGFAGLLAACIPVQATTLQQLSLGEMIQQSTRIVRAKVTGSHTVIRGNNIDTYYHLEVLETLKPGGQNVQQLEVAVPGGTAQGLRQMVPGAPALAIGSEYVAFLWTGRSGITQVIGLSQGLFRVALDASGNTVLLRPATTETMLDKNGKPVTDQPVDFTLDSLRTQIQRVLGASK